MQDTRRQVPPSLYTIEMRRSRHRLPPSCCIHGVDQILSRHCSTRRKVCIAATSLQTLGSGVANSPSLGNCAGTVRAWPRHKICKCEALPSPRDDQSRLRYNPYTICWSVEAETDRMGAMPGTPVSIDNRRRTPHWGATTFSDQILRHVANLGE